MGREPLNNPSESKKEKSGSSIISRRTFLGVSGGAAAALAGLLTVKWPGFDPSSDSDYIADGYKFDEYIYTSCLNCPTKCAINVRKVTYEDGTERAVRILGNPNSKYSEGKACPRSHIGLQVLYNPERITTPLRRKSGVSKGRNENLPWDDQWDPISWETALSEIAGRLGSVSADSLLILQGLNTTSDGDLIRRFAQSLGTTNLLREDTLEEEADKKGKEKANISANTGYDLENANYVLSFGADIIESEIPLARNLRMWGKIRRERPNKARVVVLDPRYSVTASKADEWIPLNPGTEGDLAMALAHVIISENLYDTNFVTNRTTGFDDYKAVVLAGYSPADVSERTGIDTDTIKRIAREFAEVKPAIAWSGSGATSWNHGSNASHAILCLNALVGNIDAKGGVILQETPQYQDMPAIVAGEPAISLRDTKAKLDNGSISTIIGFNNNLIMSAPNSNSWNTALSNVDYYIHIASSQTEMAQYADIILPSCTYLEEWAYETAPPGSGYAEVKLKQPAVDPFGESIATAQIIFNLIDEIGGTVATLFDKSNITDKASGDSDAVGFIKFRTKGLSSFIWSKFIDIGVWPETPDAYTYGKYTEIFRSATKKFAFDKNIVSTDKLANVSFKGSNPFILATYHPVLEIRNGNQNYPWAQEIFLVMQGRGWDNFVEISKHDADEKGIEDGEEVKVKSSVGEIKLKARVTEWIKPGVVAIAAGQGHYACGEWADGIGKNPNDIIDTDYDEQSGQASFKNTTVEIE